MKYNTGGICCAVCFWVRAACTNVYYIHIQLKALLLSIDNHCRSWWYWTKPTSKKLCCLAKKCLLVLVEHIDDICFNLSSSKINATDKLSRFSSDFKSLHGLLSYHEVLTHEVPYEVRTSSISRNMLTVISRLKKKKNGFQPGIFVLFLFWSLAARTLDGATSYIYCRNISLSIRLFT